MVPNKSDTLAHLRYLNDGYGKVIFVTFKPSRVSAMRYPPIDGTISNFTYFRPRRANTYTNVTPSGTISRSSNNNVCTDKRKLITHVNVTASVCVYLAVSVATIMDTFQPFHFDVVESPALLAADDIYTSSSLSVHGRPRK